jgi:hypothetical protein
VTIKAESKRCNTADLEDGGRRHWAVGFLWYRNSRNETKPNVISKTGKASFLGLQVKPANSSQRERVLTRVTRLLS